MGKYVDELISMYEGPKEYIDCLLNSHNQEIAEGKLSEIDVKRHVCWEILEEYASDYLSEENLIACSECLGISKNDLDLNVVREIKDRREKERENIRKYHRISREEHLKILALQSQYYKWAKCETEED